MALQHILRNTSATAWGFLLLSAVLGYFMYNYLNQKLNKISGPLIASMTDWWRLYDVSRGRHQDTLIRLHREYATDLVRIGPRTVSVADPEAVNTIYGLKTAFTKSSFYKVQQNVSQGKPLENIFNTTRDDFHAAIKRPVSHAYSMTSLVQYEPCVDSTSRLFCWRLEKAFSSTGQVCDLGTWLQYYAFDVIGELTFSKRFGFLETGSDVEGIIADVEWRLGYFAKIGQMPALDRFLLKSALAMRLIPNNHVVKFTMQQVNERISNPSDRKDFLTAFLKAKIDYPNIVSDRQVLSYANSNVFAGSDTTAISLRSILYYLLKNPPVLRRVVDEIDQVVGDRDCGQHPISYTEANKMQYFQAVLKEALRMHPAVGLLLERVVPAGGIKIAGSWLPEGTIVGICPWVLHRDVRVFGEDADTFRPERWLNASGEELKVMNRSNLAFGAGARTCLGKHISLLEMSKVVPQLLWTFEFALVRPEQEWTMHNAWFVKQTDLKVYIKTRPGRSV